MTEADLAETRRNKAEFNRRAKASMREYLRSKTWEEKIRSIERMNAVDGKMKEAMRQALQKQNPQDDPPSF